MNDIGMIEDAVLAIGDFKGEPDRAKLYKDIKIIINKYGSLDMGQVDIAEFIQGTFGGNEEQPHCYAARFYNAC